MDLGYARVSTAKQDFDRQLDALAKAGIPPERIYLDKKSGAGATASRPGLQAALGYARAGDVIVVHTLDRLGRTVRDTLNLIHELAERGVGVRNLADPIKVDSSNPNDPMAQLAVVLLALFGQMERTYTLERAAHARAVATAKGRRIGRPAVVDPDKLAYTVHLRDAGHTLADIVAKTGITRSSLYHHLPPRPPVQLTLAPADEEAPTATQIPTQAGQRRDLEENAYGILGSVTWPAGYRPACPRCAQPTEGLREKNARRRGQHVVLTVAGPIPVLAMSPIWVRSFSDKNRGEICRNARGSRGGTTFTEPSWRRTVVPFFQMCAVDREIPNSTQAARIVQP